MPNLSDNKVLKIGSTNYDSGASRLHTTYYGRFAVAIDGQSATFTLPAGSNTIQYSVDGEVTTPLTQADPTGALTALTLPLTPFTDGVGGVIVITGDSVSFNNSFTINSAGGHTTLQDAATFAPTLFGPVLSTCTVPPVANALNTTQFNFITAGGMFSDTHGSGLDQGRWSKTNDGTSQRDEGSYIEFDTLAGGSATSVLRWLSGGMDGTDYIEILMDGVWIGLLQETKSGYIETLCTFDATVAHRFRLMHAGVHFRMLTFAVMVCGANTNFNMAPSFPTVFGVKVGDSQDYNPGATYRRTGHIFSALAGRDHGVNMVVVGHPGGFMDEATNGFGAHDSTGDFFNLVANCPYDLTWCVYHGPVNDLMNYDNRYTNQSDMIATAVSAANYIFGIMFGKWPLLKFRWSFCHAAIKLSGWGGGNTSHGLKTDTGPGNQGKFVPLHNAIGACCAAWVAAHPTHDLRFIPSMPLDPDYPRPGGLLLGGYDGTVSGVFSDTATPSDFAEAPPGFQLHYSSNSAGTAGAAIKVATDMATKVFSPTVLINTRSMTGMGR